MHKVMIVVRTYEMLPCEPGKPIYRLESEKVIDHDNSSDRKWLGGHCFWAMRNDRRVETTPL